MDSSLWNALVHAHSIGRWIVLLLLVFAILNSLIAGNRPYIRTDNRLGLLLTISADLMLIIGLVLWYYSPAGLPALKAGMSGMTAYNRFFAVEHFAGMLIAIVLMHIGKSQGRKPISDRAKHRRTMIFYLIALLIILASIPWPVREMFQNRGWF
jgi:hypothetical protein